MEGGGWRRDWRVDEGRGGGAAGRGAGWAAGWMGVELKVGMEGLDGGGGAGWRRLDGMEGGRRRGRAGVEGAWMEGWGSGLDGGKGAGRGGVEGWRGLSGWRDRTAQTEPHKPNCKKNRTETKAKPIPETETNRNEPRLYCILGLGVGAQIPRIMPLTPRMNGDWGANTNNHAFFLQAISC